jgi:CxxC motif-containing protein
MKNVNFKNVAAAIAKRSNVDVSTVTKVLSKLSEIFVEAPAKNAALIVSLLISNGLNVKKKRKAKRKSK